MSVSHIHSVTVHTKAVSAVDVECRYFASHSEPEQVQRVCDETLVTAAMVVTNT
jgi:hypothetical protein